MDVLHSDGVVSAIWIVAAEAIALAAHWVFFAILRRLERGKERGFRAAAIRLCYAPMRLFLAALAALFVLGDMPMPTSARDPIEHGVGLVILGAVAWLIVAFAHIGERVIVERLDIQSRDNRRDRQILTQVVVVRRLITATIVVIAAAAMLTTFPQVRVMGTSILASAGILSIVIGFAAQSTLSNLLAGIQIAFMQPIRIDDVVVVEGEWGKIEEITFTYVVVAIWDERRLVLPISYFATTPFQNWTRTKAELLGTVLIEVDYSVSVDEVRKEVEALAKRSTLWDGRVAMVQVTDASEKTMQLRALVSAADSSAAWDLRCEVREGMLAFLNDRYPGALPRSRVHVSMNEPGLVASQTA